MKKYKILAGGLTAHPNNHGTHLNEYIAKKEIIAKQICENIILHNQILIPIQDYLTACGLILILGEDNFISLLDANQIRFLRSPHQIVFLKSKQSIPKIGLIEASKVHPRSSLNDKSIALGLTFLGKLMSLKNKKLLEKLLLKQTSSENIKDSLANIEKDTFKTFNYTSVAQNNFNDFLENLNSEQAQATNLSNRPLDVSNPIDVILGIATTYHETHLFKKYQCSSSSSTIDFNKLTGLSDSLYSKSTDGFWSITELHRIPDLGKVILSNRNYCKNIIKITRSSQAEQFRDWFHNNNLHPKELQQEFIALTDKEPWFKTTVGSYICWAICGWVGLQYGPLVGIPISLANKMLGKVKGQSPKYFISDLQQITKINN